MKTSKEIQGYVYELLKDSPIAGAISGEVYREGYRPRDSRLEDAVVIYTAGLPDDVQNGIVTINIYVPDIDPYQNGIRVENGERTQQIERLAADWVISLSKSGAYKFELNKTIYTEPDSEINQHFVVVKLAYSLYESDY